ncbi:ATP-dependent DNA helicase RecQ [Vagococcus sp. BWB3-3]|uniref:ATP-dependent DNA helicase RecQ n=1 Tax=Vagococcus allomyrinae TaxID=2794353 RepID=A0A940SV11_9ENTE|nr:ATP-dependent DNA helicase RecQ [Vagococcus allomyrinae]MBP1040616.1 ATP-dependent DNA helicase RecQ [Vagococcus allomyrinae]
MTIEALLKERFGFSQFKAGQRETVEAVLANDETLSILPTGTGKSLCYQLPSYLFKGTTIIVSPLISLMEDQVQQLKQQGEKRSIAINGQLDYQGKEWALSNLAQYKFVFFSPEMLMQDKVRQRLQELDISLFVVDEAHCISQWGIDFRPEYERLQDVIEELRITKVLALTATATEKVAEDIRKKLFVHQQPLVIRESVNRPNITYEVVKTGDKLTYIESLLKETDVPGIIYFASRKRAEEVTRLLNQRTSKRVAFYHGDMSNQERSLIQQQFLGDQLDVLCATSAFGMGVNKANVGFIVHYHLPASVEAYLQESGRAGRDGKRSLAVLLYQKGDEQIYYHMQAELAKISQQLSTFQQQTPEFIQAHKGQLAELQEKWFEGYLRQDYTLEELVTALLVKQQEKRQQLTQMLMYIELTTCRRAYLLAYFSEKMKEINQVCCDNCGNYGKILPESHLTSERNLSLPKNWQENLKKLFIF